MQLLKRNALFRVLQAWRLFTSNSAGLNVHHAQQRQLLRLLTAWHKAVQTKQWQGQWVQNACRRQRRRVLATSMRRWTISGLGAYDKAKQFRTERNMNFMQQLLQVCQGAAHLWMTGDRCLQCQSVICKTAAMHVVHTPCQRGRCFGVPSHMSLLAMLTNISW